ncbi:MAG: tRNA preQ1(34) S-adenosylmethionine ribosyltransferase-isomerase QueA [Anaerolineae bacterium]|nr:MAG: tRNA preQ1(34) S-adenosylmethionine ribosyltransferase-isomerase QueA [Anaerolineae bacterium]
MDSEDRLKIADFDYHLPTELIAQEPLPERDKSRLMVLNRSTNHIEHRHFQEIIDYFRPGDVIVINDSRVIPARIKGQKVKTGGNVELLLLEQLNPGHWRVLVGGRRLQHGSMIHLFDRNQQTTNITAEVINVLDGPVREVKFSRPIIDELMDIGHTPLPPYIRKPIENPDRYQTIYARPPGSAAAPTAGLHFTSEILLSLREMGVLIETITLHIGLDTFKPISTEFIDDHDIHSEWVTLSPEAARRINEAKLTGGRIWATGTTTVRALETAALRSAGLTGSLSEISSLDRSGHSLNACGWRPVVAIDGKTDLFIYPGYQFRAVDVLITNFHLPQSSLILLVSAFAGIKTVARAYKQAIENQYRFYSFGDAMLIL